VPILRAEKGTAPVRNCEFNLLSATASMVLRFENRVGDFAPYSLHAPPKKVEIRQRKNGSRKIA
jgi:hypothetical protein